MMTERMDRVAAVLSDRFRLEPKPGAGRHAPVMEFGVAESARVMGPAAPVSVTMKALEKRPADRWRTAAWRSTRSRRGGDAMDAGSLRIVRSPIARADLAALAERQFGDMVKAVVDVARGVMAIGGELHADEEAALLDDGSRQSDLWGINLYPGERGTGWIEFDSMINVRPAQGNRSRDVEDEGKRDAIRRVVSALVAVP